MMAHHDAPSPLTLWDAIVHGHSWYIIGVSFDDQGCHLSFVKVRSLLLACARAAARQQVGSTLET